MFRCSPVQVQWKFLSFFCSPAWSGCCMRGLHRFPKPVPAEALQAEGVVPRPVTSQYKIIVIQTRDFLDCNYSQVFTQVWACVFMLLYWRCAFPPQPKAKVPKSQKRFCHLEAHMLTIHPSASPSAEKNFWFSQNRKSKQGICFECTYIEERTSAPDSLICTKHHDPGTKHGCAAVN